MSMEPISYADYRRACRGDRYLLRRWRYYSKAIALVRRLAPQTVLEIGPGPLSLFPGSDTLDRNELYRPTHLHDATVTPWPIHTKAYDLIVALQVWEHLDGRQREAFQELERCARRAILSIPYCWKVRSDPVHSGIGDADVRDWAGGLAAVDEILIPRYPWRRHRKKIYVFDFTADDGPAGRHDAERRAGARSRPERLLKVSR